MRYVYHAYATHETSRRLDKFDAIVERNAPVGSYAEYSRLKLAVIGANPAFTGLTPESITIESLTLLHTKE